jgi:hypothetical protein
MSGGIHHLITKFITIVTAKCPVKVCPSTVCGAGSGLFTCTTVTQHEVGILLWPAGAKSKIEIEIGTGGCSWGYLLCRRSIDPLPSRS